MKDHAGPVEIRGGTLIFARAPPRGLYRRARSFTEFHVEFENSTLNLKIILFFIKINLILEFHVEFEYKKIVCGSPYPNFKGSHPSAVCCWSPRSSSEGSWSGRFLGRKNSSAFSSCWEIRTHSLFETVHLSFLY
ncbi:hypothetical protein BpHYR1_039604 [Brachionus plicatilis]|uniref:Uncharacterized protein n=1 Tax=Brachionus plicatilis TaxID=10195 RepID=A0A3M7RQ84_BRAPC|nr:hypothetical protein BpHYR1_039604 [Brachionus plicatilis]